MQFDWKINYGGGGDDEEYRLPYIGNRLCRGGARYRMPHTDFRPLIEANYAMHAYFFIILCRVLFGIEYEHHSAAGLLDAQIR